MADGTKIEWADATWNPVTGCTVLSPGCTNCYAMRLAGTRMRRHHSRIGLTDMTKAGPVWNGSVRLNEQWLDEPIRWRKPRRIFVCAHGDLFHGAVPDEWIDKVFAVMALAPQHRFLVLTKRAQRMRDYCAGAAQRVWFAVGETPDGWRVPRLDGCPVLPALAAHGAIWGGEEPWPLRNVDARMTGRALKPRSQHTGSHSTSRRRSPPRPATGG